MNPVVGHLCNWLVSCPSLTKPRNLDSLAEGTSLYNEKAERGRGIVYLAEWRLSLHMTMTMDFVVCVQTKIAGLARADLFDGPM